MRCLRPDRLAALASGRLARGRAAEARRHLAECAACRLALSRIDAATAALREAALLPAPEITGPRSEATIRWLRLPPARAVRPGFAVAFALTACIAALALFVGRAPHRAELAPRLALAPPSHPAELGALITLLGGRVELTRGAHTAPLTADSVLRAADRLTTARGARVAAEWSAGSGFLLLGNAELAFEELAPASQRFRLPRGEVDVRVGAAPPGARETLAVQTPGHLVSVHGSWFTVAADGPRTTVEVLEGSAEVTELDGSASTLLTAPARAVFGPGRSSNVPLSARDAAARRAESALNLIAFDDLARATAATGLLAVSSEPLGTLAIDGVTLGPTPLEVRRPLGRHFVEIDRRDFLPLKRWVVVGPERGELRVALVRSGTDLAPEGPIGIEEMVRLRAHQIRACYERSLKRDPTLKGTVTLRLHIGASGRVTRTHVDDSTLADPLVAECLAHEAAAWKFTLGPAGRPATVVYPFVFRPQ
jgi:hypothetical protein